MEIEVNTDWTVGNLIDLQSNSFLVVDHEYQRGLRWSPLQKRMFIDSILRGYSIPAFYLHKKKTLSVGIQNTHYYIVDGQQRIDAICSYCDGSFELLDPSKKLEFRFPNFFSNYSCPWGGKRFSELPKDIQIQLKAHKVVVYEITTNNENEIRDLFIRLQGGTPLTPQDKRDSWPGNFTDFILKVGGKSEVERWFGYPLFLEVLKAVNESKRRQLAAQVYMLFWTVRNEHRFCDIKSANLDEFYHCQVNFDEDSSDAKRFKKICEVIEGAMIGSQRVMGHYIIHLFLFVDSLIGDYVKGWENDLASKLREFDTRQKQAAEDVKNRRETENEIYYSEYGQLTRTSSDQANTIRQRHAFFSEVMLKLLSPTRLDDTSKFSNIQRQTVFFRDKGLCQWCRMNGTSHKVLWEESHIHNVIPYSESGVNEVSNAALVHRDCHPRSYRDLKSFRDWWSYSSRNSLSQTQRKKFKRNFLPPDGTKCKLEYRGRLYSGEIFRRKLVLDSTCGYGEFRSFSRASHEVMGRSSNGWMDWEILLPDEEDWLLADDWRNRE